MTTKTTTTIATVTYRLWTGGPMDGRMADQLVEERFSGRRTVRGCQLVLSRAYNDSASARGCAPKSRPSVVSVRHE
jgi:hypothetical protein